MRVASRNCTLAHIPRFEKMADSRKLVRPNIIFTDLPEGYWTSFWAKNFVIFIFSSNAAKKDELKSLNNFGGFSWVCLFDYDVFDRIVYLQLPKYIYVYL